MLEGLSNLLGDLTEKVGGALQDVKIFITEKPVVSAAIGTGIVGAGASAVGVAVAKRRTKKKSKKKTSKGRSRDRKYISKQKHETAYQKRRKRLGKKTYGKRYKKRSKSKKRVGKTYFTKKGQPYKIMASGKARFIKKRRRSNN